MRTFRGGKDYRLMAEGYADTYVAAFPEDHRDNKRITKAPLPCPAPGFSRRVLSDLLPALDAVARFPKLSLESLL